MTLSGKFGKIELDVTPVTVVVVLSVTIHSTNVHFKVPLVIQKIESY